MPRGFEEVAEEHSFRDWYRKGCAKFASPIKHMKPFAESPEIAIFDSFTDRELRCFSVQFAESSGSAAHAPVVRATDVHFGSEADILGTSGDVRLGRLGAPVTS